MRPSAVALFFWVALVGPMARSFGTPGASLALVLIIVAGAGTAVLLTRESRWKLRLLLAFGAGAALTPSQGDLVAGWGAASLALAPWIAQDRPPLPFLAPAASGAAGPVVALCGVAAWIGRSPTTTWQPLVPILLAVVATASPLGERLALVGERVGTLASTAVSRVAFFLVGFLVVILPWVGQQLRLVAPPGRPSGWARREQRALQPAQIWVREAAPTRPPLQIRRARRAAWSLAAGAALVGVLILRGSSPSDSEPSASSLAGPVESGDAPLWYADYREDIAWVFDDRVALRPFEVYRLLDVRTRHVNIDEGDRVSWTPPPCRCDRLRVWLYGGSAAFGLEQRDDHTVASELSRLAAESGLVLDVRNRGIPGQLHWRTALRFGWDLTQEAPPDLVVFYEGAEEVAAAVQLTRSGLGDTRAPYEPYIENLYDEIYDVADDPLPPPEGVQALGWPTTPDRGEPGSAGQLAAARYGRSLEISGSTAERYDVPIRYVWHPSRRAPAGEGDPFLEASDHLRPEVLDLTELLANQPDVEFVDDVHHDERGASEIADALFAALEPQLRALSEGGDPP